MPKISALPADAALLDTDIVPVVDLTAVATKKATVAQLRAVPTSTGFRHVTAGAEDSAARAVDLSTADVTGSLPGGSVSGAVASATTATTATTAASALHATSAAGLDALIVDAQIDPAAGIQYSKLALAGDIVNADIASAASIAYSKLNLASSLVNADINASAAIAYSKLALAGTIVNADINVSAAIAYSKLNLTGAILNGDLAGSIALGKLAAGTAGDIIYYSGGTGASWATLPAGTSAQFLKSNGSSAPAWANVNVTTERVDLVAGVALVSIAGIWTRIGGCSFDLSLYPSTLNGLTRHVQFHGDIQMTSGATTAEVKLVDVTHGVDVTSTDTTTSSTSAARFTSADLTVGSSSGNLRSDVVAEYEVQLKMNGGGPTDAVACISARLVVTYS